MYKLEKWETSLFFSKSAYSTNVQCQKMQLTVAVLISLSRKADLRELKVLQKIEKKQYQDLMLKAQYVRDQQTKKIEQETQVWQE